MLLSKLNLVEKYAPDTKVTWLQLGSGAAINEALIAGKLISVPWGWPLFNWH